MRVPELDHLGLAARDLAPLCEMFLRLGFVPTQPRALSRRTDDGKTEPLGQISAHVVLGSTYVEFSAVPDPGTGNHLEPFLARYQGLHIIALRSDDLAASRQAALRSGLQPAEIQAAEREISYGRRQGRAQFNWWMLPVTDISEGLLCFVDNLRPELVYQDSVQSHPNGALNITGVVVRARDQRRSLLRWRQALGMDEQSAGRNIALRNAHIDFPAVDRPALPPPPSLVGLEITVADLAQARQFAEPTGWLLPDATSTTLTLRLPAPANVLLVFRAAG